MLYYFSSNNCNSLWLYLTANKDPLDATNVLTHGCNSIFMFIDLWIVAHPLRLLHVFLPVLFGGIYAMFSFIYQMCGGINKWVIKYCPIVSAWINFCMYSLLQKRQTVYLSCDQLEPTFQCMYNSSRGPCTLLLRLCTALCVFQAAPLSLTYFSPWSICSAEHQRRG